MSESSDKKFLFIHVMKTGGTSFTDIIKQNFTREERYPDAVLPADAIMAQHMEAYTHVPKVLKDVNSAGAKPRIVSGHVPYAIHALLKGEFEAITVLRNPVSRTISYLKHCRKYHVEHQGMNLEDIYEEHWFFESFIHNYQTKLFSMSAEETLCERRLGDMTPPLPPRHAFAEGKPPPVEAKPLLENGFARLALELFSSSTGVIETDQRRLDVARNNLDAMALVGTTEHYKKFLESLQKRYGWRIGDLPYRNVGDAQDVTPEFRKRIEQDNNLDMALHDYALSLLP